LTRYLRQGDPDELFDRNGPLIGPLIERHAPDWILFTDADEFLMAADGDLGPMLRSTDVDALTVERYNVPLMQPPFAPTSGATDGPFLDAPIVVRKEQVTRSRMDEDPRQRWVTAAIRPRVLCRTSRFGGYQLGAHGARSIDGAPLAAPIADRIVIVHVPFTTPERFARKVTNARAFLTRWSAQYTGQTAWHWRRWIEAADAGRLDAEFERELVAAETVRAWTEDGTIATARALMALDDVSLWPGVAGRV
jgi:hypothetical protein